MQKPIKLFLTVCAFVFLFTLVVLVFSNKLSPCDGILWILGVAVLGAAVDLRQTELKKLRN